MYSARQRRALKLKEFIKSGCSYSIVQVDVKNEGIDSFKPDIFGDTIIIERRITDYQLQCFERLSRYPVLVVNVYAPWCFWSTRLVIYYIRPTLFDQCYHRQIQDSIILLLEQAG